MKGLNRLFFQAILLSFLGIFIQFIFGSEIGLNQLSYLIVAVLSYLLIIRIDSYLILKFNNLMALLGVILLALLFIVGDPIRGAHRWFVIFGFNMQPSIVFLPFFLLFEAKLLVDRKERTFSNFFLVLALIGIPVLLIFKQPDLGTALVVGLSLFGITYAAYFPLIYYLWLSFIALPFGLIATKFLKPYQISRLVSFINPNYDPSGINYNSLQSIIAIGSGFFFGKGFNFSSQSRLLFLPEAHTDFVFAAFTEAFGFIGSLVIMGLFLTFLLTLLNELLDENQSALSRYYYFGLLSYFFIQSVFNIGMNLRLLPVVGVPLPFISYGGSSLLSNFILLAIGAKIKEIKLV